MGSQETVLNITLDVDFNGTGEGRHEFAQKSVIIGSGSAANLRIDDSSISSIHAILKAGDENTSALLSDLGSEDGTRINGREISREAAIKRGDKLEIGDVEIHVVGVGQEDEVTRPAEPAPVREVAQEEELDEAEEIPDEDVGDMEEEPTLVPEEPVVEARPSKKPPKPAPKVKSKRKKKAKAAAEPELDTGEESGRLFFEREVLTMERPSKSDGLLEVKVAWGQIVLDARQFAVGESVTIGDGADASIQVGLAGMEGESFTLLSSGGKTGCVVNVASGMKLDVRKEGKSVDVDSLPSAGAVRTYALDMTDRCRVTVGQLAFVIQYVAPGRGVVGSQTAASESRMGKWFSLFLLVAIGLWTMVQLTPAYEVDASDYLKNPARFAQLLMPTQAQEKKKSFDEIKKKEKEKIKVEEKGQWEKVQSKAKTKNTKDVPREVKEKIDRKIATSAGILGLLKAKGGGSGDNSSSLFGGSGMTNLDQSLASLRNTGMGDSGGFGGLGTRGGGPGGGSGLGLGGLGTHGYGRGSGKGYGSIKIGHRGKHGVRVVKGRTRVMGGLSQKVVGRYIQRYWAQFKYCYERELTKAPNLYGKITVTFTIAGNGRVSDATVIQTTMHNANVEECVLRVVRRIRFPSPKGAGEVIVTYPFMFTTTG